MSDWVKIGTRYINLSNVTEVRVHEQPQFARIYFTNGATIDLDEDDSEILLLALRERLSTAAETPRTIIAPPASA